MDPTKDILLSSRDNIGFIITEVNTFRKSRNYVRENDKDNNRKSDYKLRAQTETGM
jgi:hypothetical protein